MSKADVNLNDLEALLRQLQAFNASFISEWNRMKSSWSQLNSTWNDQQKEKFRRDWEVTQRDMERYIQKSNDYISFIQGRVNAAREYEGS